jgi:glycosyltransferase involved in cell wall biosynthesis
MRFLFLNHNVRGSGTYLRAFRLARELVQCGHKVALVTTSAGARVSMRARLSDGVEVVEAPDLFWGRGRTGWDPWNTLRRLRALRGRAFDVVHAFDSRPAVIHPALAVQRWSGAPLFMDWADWWGRGGWINDRSGWAVRTLFGPVETWYEEHFRTNAAGTTTISTALAQRAVKLGVPQETVLYLPNGCDPTRIRPQERARARVRLGIAQNEKVLLHLGVLTTGDYALLRAAFARVRQAERQARLVLLGRTAIPVAEEAGVTVTGAVLPEGVALHDWLAAANACVVPCRDTIGNAGRWPSKVNDYLAAGRAVVMPRVGDVGALIERTGAGWATADTPESFAEGMLAAISDPAACAAAGARARAVAERELAWSVLSEKLLRFYALPRGSMHARVGVAS